MSRPAARDAGDPVLIREATPDDHVGAGEATAEAYREFVVAGSDWERYLERIRDLPGRAGRTVIVVAEDGGRLVGSATLELEGRTEADAEPLPPDVAHIRMLGVHPDARGRGVGRRLMEACEARALAAGRTVMTLNTTQRMEAAQRMYESMGYVRGADEVFPDGFVLLSYAKRLSP
jgi:ribosomal protein S18 acetylase RimI-like enzyme